MQALQYVILSHHLPTLKMHLLFPTFNLGRYKLKIYFQPPQTVALSSLFLYTRSCLRRVQRCQQHACLCDPTSTHPAPIHHYIIIIANGSLSSLVYTVITSHCVQFKVIPTPSTHSVHIDSGQENATDVRSRFDRETVPVPLYDEA
jgi:hypothetical protein